MNGIRAWFLRSSPWAERRAAETARDAKELAEFRAMNAQRQADHADTHEIESAFTDLFDRDYLANAPIPLWPTESSRT